MENPWGVEGTNQRVFRGGGGGYGYLLEPHIRLYLKPPSYLFLCLSHYFQIYHEFCHLSNGRVFRIHLLTKAKASSNSFGSKSSHRFGKTSNLFFDTKRFLIFNQKWTYMIKTTKDHLLNELPCSVTVEISSPDNWV